MPYTSHQLTQGTRVNTPHGIGRVAYVRNGPPNFSHVDAVSVMLDSKRYAERYNGTIVPERDVTIVHFYVWWMTPKGADEHERRTRNIPPDVKLGWTPYTIVVQTLDVLAHTAFTNVRDFRRWLQAHGYSVQMHGRHHRRAFRGGYIITRRSS